MANERTISSREEMRSLLDEAMAVHAGAPGGKAEVISVGQLQRAGEMVFLMDGLVLLGWEFKGGVVLRRLARADGLLASIADRDLQHFIENPRAPNLYRELMRLGWKVSNASRIHGHRRRTPDARAPRQPTLNRLGNTLRRLARYAKKEPRPIKYIERRLRLLRDEVIPSTRATDVVLGYPAALPPGGKAVDVSSSTSAGALPPGGKTVDVSSSTSAGALPPGGKTVDVFSSSSTSAGSTSSGSSTSTARSPTPSSAAGSSTGSDHTYNSNCSACVEGRPHLPGCYDIIIPYVPGYYSSHSSDSSDF